MFFTTFGYFSDEENELVIKNAAKALKSGGRLLIDVFNPMRLIANLSRSREPVMKSWYEVGNYYVLGELKIDVLNAKSIDKRIFIKKPSMEIAEERTAIIRYYLPHEIIQLLKRHDFRVLKIYGNYRGEEFNLQSPRLIVVAERSAKERQL